MSKQPSTEQVLHHIGYEWWMFRTMARLLSDLPDSDDPVRNALVESLLLHARNLADFFFERKNGKNPRAEDFGVTYEPKPPLIKNWWVRASQDALHVERARFRPNTRDPLEVDAVWSIFGAKINELRAATSIPLAWIGDYDARTQLIPSDRFVSSPGPVGATGATGPTGPTGPPVSGKLSPPPYGGSDRISGSGIWNFL